MITKPSCVICGSGDPLGAELKCTECEAPIHYDCAKMHPETKQPVCHHCKNKPVKQPAKESA